MENKVVLAVPDDNPKDITAFSDLATDKLSLLCIGNDDVPVGSYWNKVLRIGPNPRQEGGQWPDVYTYFLTMQCQHCEDPECVKVCPTGASHKLADGTVQVDKEKCIGCKYCMMACPYGVRYLNEEEGVVEKCTLCQQRTAQGELPQCVSQCCGMARWYGDAEQGIESFEGPRGERLGDFVNDFTEDQVYKLTDVGNGPSMFYIMRNIKWQGVE